MKLVLSTLVLSLTLVGCGSSNKSKDKTTTTQPPVVTTPTTPTAPPEVHSIQPADVAAYVENYKQQRNQLSLQLDGVETEFSFVDFEMEANLLIAKLNQGVLLIGFDVNKQEGLPNLALYKSTATDVNAILDKPDTILQGNNIALSGSDNNIVYEGSLITGDSQDNINVRLVINDAFISGGASEVKVEGEQAFVTGTLGTEFYVQLSELIAQNPAVKTLVLQNIQGSLNDAINMHSGRLVRNAQLTTLMPPNGEAHSGGVDLFASGYKRVYQAGGQLGVHSWCCVDGKHAGELSKDHEAHGAQLTYVREMLGAELGPEFYFFTLAAAPFNGIHLMTQAEIDKYLAKN